MVQAEIQGVDFVEYFHGPVNSLKSGNFMSHQRDWCKHASSYGIF